MQERKEKCWVRAKVVSVSGTCHAGQKVGDEVVFADTEVQGRICFDAMCSMMPKVYGLRYNADLPWLKDPNAPAKHACPDPVNPVVYELTRIPKK